MRAVLPLILGLTLTLAACSRTEPAPEPVRAVRTLKVRPQAGALAREYAAEVKARTESRLAFRVGGKLLSRPVDIGQPVRRGQLLAQLDPADLKLGQEAAQAAVLAAQTQVDQSQADQRRAAELHAQGFIGAAELERRDSALKAAQATLAQARAQAGVQGNQAQYSQLLADAAGVVTAVEAEPGAVLGAGTAVLRVANDGPRDVVFQVPEDQLSAVRALLNKTGALQVRLWGDERELPATVREVAAAADPVGRTFQVKADVGRAEVRLGQTATVVLPGTPREGLIALPLAAVAEQGGRSVVWVLDAAAMTVQPQPVTLGGAQTNAVLISAGLQAGQEVVTAGVHVLTPGLKVKRYLEPQRPGGPSVAASAATAASR
jgi:membrane fusion protein, multidrug efflux system